MHLKMEINLEDLMRPNIRKLIPYTSARSEFTGKADIFIDANENAFASVGTSENYTRYPDPLQKSIKKKLAELENISPSQIFLGNGSDEGIDLLMRVFCQPAQDKILIMPPTYGMYQVCANINEVEVIKIPLKTDFQIDLPKALEAIKIHQPKIVFVCSPNNPTGNLLKREDILALIKATQGIVAIDEAYIDFCPEHSFLKEIQHYNHLIIFRTFSKAWGLAALRLGIAFAHETLINALNKVKPPYNINAHSQKIALEALARVAEKDKLVKETLEAKADLLAALGKIPTIEQIFPSDTNFIFLKMQNAIGVYQDLLQQGIIIRNQTKVYPEGLRITVGTPDENKALLECLKKYV